MPEKNELESFSDKTHSNIVDFLENLNKIHTRLVREAMETGDNSIINQFDSIGRSNKSCYYLNNNKYDSQNQPR